jgi:hypothetical protein
MDNAHTSAVRINYLAVVVTALLAFALSLLWYSPLLFGDIWIRLSHADPSAMPLWKKVLAPLRELITAFLLAQLIVRLRITDWKRGAMLGLALWFAFYAVQLAGAVVWDNRPWRLGAVHAGDWLMKMLLMSVLLSVWHSRTPAASRRAVPQSGPGSGRQRPACQYQTTPQQSTASTIPS